MIMLIVYLPLATSLVVGFGGAYFGSQGAIVLSVFLSFLNFCFVCFFFKYPDFTLMDCYSTFFETFTRVRYYPESFGELVYSVNLGHWLTIGNFSIDWSFRFDNLTFVMLFAVTAVSLAVHMYSVGYMEYDAHLPRFLSYLSLFTFFMLVLVTSGNFFILFIGWEGVGLCSYLLISFWFTRANAVRAATKAMLVNKIGDFGLIVAIIYIYAVFGSVEYTKIFPLVSHHAATLLYQNFFHIHAIPFICFFLLLAAVGKSAQLGLHTWLPDAMEGPTPVSALIHAATMVTAGVFLIIRCSALFELSGVILHLMTIIGGLTALFGASVACLQQDIKKIVAYSTCSQLGYMVLICGLSGYSISLYHLFNHAFFKALLFLIAGVIIHIYGERQDIRTMGGLAERAPTLFFMWLLGSVALMGLPGSSGFYSKHAIINFSFSSGTPTAFFAFLCAVLTSLLTVCYSVKIVFNVFGGSHEFRSTGIDHVQCSARSLIRAFFFDRRNFDFVKFSLWAPLFFLSFLTVFTLFFRTYFIDSANFSFSQSIAQRDHYSFLVRAEDAPAWINSFSTFGVIALLLLNVYFFLWVLHESTSLWGWLTTFPKFDEEDEIEEGSDYWRSFNNFLEGFFMKLWHFDKVYNNVFVAPFLRLSDKLYVEYDKGLLERYGPTMFYNVNFACARMVSRFQTGHVHDYASYLLVFVSLILGIFLLDFMSTEAYELNRQFNWGLQTGTGELYQGSFPRTTFL